MKGIARELPRWARWLLGVGGVVVAILAALSLLLAASMSGGFDNLLDFRKPDADDKRVVRAGRVALEKLAEDGDALAAAMAPSLGAALGGTGITACDQGQHNWKVDDDYDLRCTARRVIAFAHDAGSSGQRLAQVGQELSAAGWTSAYETRVLPLADGARIPVGGHEVAAYTRDDERLTLRAFGAAGFYSGDNSYTDLPPMRMPDGSEVPVADLPARAPAGHYTLLLQIERPYFEE